jgi:Flp pilus assembly pilin Flp
MMKNLWNDEAGAIISAELVLVATILVIGMIVGLTSLRDAVVTELNDVGEAIASLNQTYYFGGVTGHSSATNGSTFFDKPDFCDPGATGQGQGSRCTTFTCAGTAEGN